ncbi:MAG: 50S ribosomal protein L10 [Clostridiales bacterium]|jgi:large subunit ribosomal protein L10|nr:50S ribosomal protein L10 [Clostridiales bacterium]
MPSKKILEEKQAQVAALSESIKNAAAGVLVQYTGITVEQDTALRTELRKAGVQYKVYKNSITRHACIDAGYPDMVPYLVGMTALAVSPEDQVAAAKILKSYAEKIENFELKAGFVDGGVLDAKGVSALAEIPGKETLIAKMLGSLQSSLYGLAYVLQAKIDKENSGEEAPAAAAEAE